MPLPAASAILSPNDLLALWSWLLLMGVATGASFSNARKNAGLPLARVWITMTVLCGYWFTCAVIGLMGGPFVTLYRIGIGAAVVAGVLLWLHGDFRTPK